MNPLLRNLVSLACAIALLVVGAQGLIHILAWLGKALGTFGPDTDPLPFLGIYSRIVMYKGLLPQLVLAFGLWLLARSLFGRRELAAWRCTAELALASLVAFAIVTPLLLGVDALGLPALVMTTSSDVAKSALLMTAATTACLALPLWLLPRPRAA